MRQGENLFIYLFTVHVISSAMSCLEVPDNNTNKRMITQKQKGAETRRKWKRKNQ